MSSLVVTAYWINALFSSLFLRIDTINQLVIVTVSFVIPFVGTLWRFLFRCSKIAAIGQVMISYVMSLLLKQMIVQIFFNCVRLCQSWTSFGYFRKYIYHTFICMYILKFIHRDIQWHEKKLTSCGHIYYCMLVHTATYN